MRVHRENSRQMFTVSHIFVFVAFVMSALRNPTSLSHYSDVFHTISTICKPSLLQNVSVFSVLLVEKRAVFLSFSNVKRTKKENKYIAKTKSKLK
jgi:hypothetical protein